MLSCTLSWCGMIGIDVWSPNYWTKISWCNSEALNTWVHLCWCYLTCYAQLWPLFLCYCIFTTVCSAIGPALASVPLLYCIFTTVCPAIGPALASVPLLLHIHNCLSYCRPSSGLCSSAPGTPDLRHGLLLNKPPRLYAIARLLQGTTLILPWLWNT